MTRGNIATAPAARARAGGGGGARRRAREGAGAGRAAERARAHPHAGPPGWPAPAILLVAARAPRGSFVRMKTYVATPLDRERNWLLVDAEGQTLGRLATQIADALRGKRKPTYTPHVDVGDFVVVVNAEKISVTGNKRAEKRYYRHSGYPGGLKSRTLNDMLERRPEEVIRLAVRGMLPRNRLARKQLTKLKIYAGPEHPHAAQRPQPMEINS
jgi:large subunit ribosomal protein L13